MTGSTKTEAKASAKWAGAGLGVLVVLEVVKGAVDSFDPRLAVNLLLVLGVGLTGLAIEMYSRSDRNWRAPWAFGPAALAACAFVAVVVVGMTAGISVPQPLSVEAQAENAKAAGEAGDRHSIGSERVDFRGSGRQSYVFEFGDEEGVPGSRARSDEIQVWDVRGGDLVRALAFEPRLLGGEQLHFQFRDVGDIDGDGAEELVGGFGTEAIKGELLVPFAVDWDSDAQRYELIALTPEPPELATGARGEDVRGLRDAYARRLTLGNRHPESVKLAGYPAQDFTVSPTHQVLINAYATDIKAERRVLELQPHVFQRTGGPPRMNPCALEGIPTLKASLPPARSQRLEGALQEFWVEATGDRGCGLSP